MYFTIGISFIMIGALILVVGLRRQESTMVGLKFRALVTGIIAIILGLYLVAV